ncbi:MAG: aminoacetone oxidase family FAD-binding enzyme, partial [Oscillospiraceae bacterium]
MKRWRNKINNFYDIIIIGGGAAGLLAGGISAKAGKSVLLFDKNEKLARKVRITGKGRCNLTNNCDAQSVIAAVPGNGKFLYSAINAFPPRDVMTFFEEQGVPLKTERGNRVFPVSDNANDIANALGRFAKINGVHFQQITVMEVLTDQGRVIGVKAGGERYEAEKVLVATGGASYCATGSTGDGYRFAAALGHRVIPPRPSLVALTSHGVDCTQMQGLALKNCGLTLWEQKKNKCVYEDFGELLFTHFGISGPIVLSASAHMREEGEYRLLLDMKPALSFEQLDA